MTWYRFVAALLPLIACGFTGCTTLTHGAPPLPDGFTIREVARADAGAPFAVSRAGALAAVQRGTIAWIDPEGAARAIAQGSASALSFSPSGQRLAAALPGEEKTVLRLFDREGKVLGETTVPERITSLAWRSETQLLAAGLGITRFSFGSGLASRLYQWDGNTPPAGTTMSDVTVRAPLAKLPEETLQKTLLLALSPYGDEIAYSALKDPPVFTPFLKISVRHLESGAEKEVGKTSVGSGGVLFTPDGESLLVSDAQALTRRLTIPDGRETDAWPSPGSHPALSPSGSHVFLDGRLYQGGRSIASFAPQARGAFLPDGSGLAISCDGRLYLVSGLKDRAAQPLTPAPQRLLDLRRLRSLDLISEQEYRAQKKKVPLP